MHTITLLGIGLSVGLLALECVNTLEYVWLPRKEGRAERCYFSNELMQLYGMYGFG
jgi:hypothetical protein